LILEQFEVIVLIINYQFCGVAFQLQQAKRAFAMQARGPACERYLEQLEQECEQVWKNGRQMCEEISLTGNHCINEVS